MSTLFIHSDPNRSIRKFVAKSHRLTALSSNDPIVVFSWRWTRWRRVDRIATSLRLIRALWLLEFDAILLSSTKVALVALIAVITLVGLIGLIVGRVWRSWIVLLLVVVIWLPLTGVLSRTVTRGRSTCCPARSSVWLQVSVAASAGSNATTFRQLFCTVNR